MFIDKLALLCDGMAYNGTPEVYDFGVTSPCKTDTFDIFISAPGDAVGDATNDLIKVTLLTGSTSSPATEIGSATFDSDAVNAGAHFQIPSNCERYFTIALSLITAGTIDCGIVANAQSNT